MSESVVLEVELRFALDRFALRAGFETAAPVTGIFGPSGAGKSSLLAAIAGLRRRVEGHVRLGNEVWLDSAAGRFVPPERRHVGYVPQDGLLFPNLDVRGNLRAGRERARREGRSAETTLAMVAELLELEPLLERDVAALSGGERQRVALGRAICSGPRLLLLDEPLAALDLPLRRRLLPFLRRAREELTIPMLLVSHDPIEIQALCDEVIVLRRGEVIARGEPRQVLTDRRVFPLALAEGFENVLSGRLERQADGTARVELGRSGRALVATGGGEVAEGDVLVGIPGNEIVIAIERPHGLSARNVLPATVTAVRTEGDRGLVTTTVAEELPPLAVEVTAATPGRLGLVPGEAIFLVFKATSCRLYGGVAG